MDVVRYIRDSCTHLLHSNVEETDAERRVFPVLDPVLYHNESGDKADIYRFDIYRTQLHAKYCIEI